MSSDIEEWVGKQEGRSEERLQVGSVDSFQGKEFDVVFLSTVRSHRKASKKTPYGFLSIPNRLCVSMSRQRKLLVVAGDMDMFDSSSAEEQIPPLYNFLKLCRSSKYGQCR